jgi:hypothetical protein
MFGRGWAAGDQERSLQQSVFHGPQLSAPVPLTLVDLVGAEHLG